MESNMLIGPSTLGDPVTALLIDTERNMLVSGTATGRVTAFAIPHVFLSRVNQQSLNDSQRAAVAEVRAAIAQNEYPAAALARGSDEGIRSLFWHEQRLFALVGDINAKTWLSYDAQGYQLIKYHRMHQSSTCAQTYTLHHGAHILLLTRDTSEGLLIDLQSGEQRPYAFALSSRSLPVSFDAERLVVVTNSSTAVLGSGEAPQRQAQEVAIFNVRDMRMVMRIITNHVEQHYWGFQLVGTDLLAYVSNLSCVKLVRLPPRDSLAATLELEGIEREHVVFRCNTGERILAFFASTSANDVRVWTLTADRCARYFLNGELVSCFSNLYGEIGSMGYPHVLRVCEKSNVLFYSADDGIFSVDLLASK